MVPQCRTLAVLLLSAGLAIAGCQRNNSGSSTGNHPNSTGGTSSRSTSDSANSGNGGNEGQRKGDQGQPANAGNQNQTHTEPSSPEPVNSVSGRPSTASDDGSASAVAHRSVAQPGAPEGTLENQVPGNAQKAQPGQQPH